MATPPTDVVDALSTAGWSGADGFFRCDVTYTADATVAPTVSIVAAAFSRRSRNVSDRDRRLQERHPVE